MGVPSIWKGFDILAGYLRYGSGFSFNPFVL
jgi:hypothetical protein